MGISRRNVFIHQLPFASPIKKIWFFRSSKILKTNL
jgi:hypothetical protein